MSLNREELFEYATKHIKTDDNSDVLELDCKNIIFLLDNCEITVPESNRFFITVNCEGIQKNIYNKRMHLFSHEIAESGLYVGDEARAYTGYYDFSHTTAQWESVLSLGITGLRKRISEYAEKNKGDEKKDRFYKEISKVYDAALRFLKRASDAAAACGKNEMAEGIKSLTEMPRKIYLKQCRQPLFTMFFSICLRGHIFEPWEDWILCFIHITKKRIRKMQKSWFWLI